MLKVFQRWIDRYFSDEEAILLLLLLVAVLTVILSLGHVLAPFLTALVVTYLLQGSVQWLKRLGLNHRMATLLIFILFVGVMVLLLFIILPAAWQQLMQLFYELPRMVEEGQEFLNLLPQQYPQWVSEAQLQTWLSRIGDDVAAAGQAVVSYSLSGITLIMALLIYCVLVPILVFFLLKDSEQIAAWLGGLLPVRRRLLSRIWHEMDIQIANYVRGKVLEIIIVGVVSYVVFAFWGLNYAALLAVAVGLSVLVPYIGAAVVTVPVALVGFLQWGWGDTFLWLMVAYAVIQALDGNVLVPLLFSEVVKLHPVAIIVAVLVFGGLWGFWGVFFAIPLATLLKAILQAWPDRNSPVDVSSSDSV